LRNGAHINEKDNINQTALLLASYSGNKSIVEILLDKNADINSKTNKGFSALHLGFFFKLIVD
jgi:serine/threonine-protein phosphatase 6 regulatory ankyrin repeat subunit B